MASVGVKKVNITNANAIIQIKKIAGLFALHLAGDDLSSLAS